MLLCVSTGLLLEPSFLRRLSSYCVSTIWSVGFRPVDSQHTVILGGRKGGVARLYSTSFICFVAVPCNMHEHPEGEGRGLAQPSSSAWRLESWGRGGVGVHVYWVGDNIEFLLSRCIKCSLAFLCSAHFLGDTEVTHGFLVRMIHLGRDQISQTPSLSG